MMAAAMPPSTIKPGRPPGTTFIVLSVASLYLHNAQSSRWPALSYAMSTKQMA